jgi:hypothetical protein
VLTERPTSLPAVIARYAASVHASVRQEHQVVSPLGAWLVLALAGLADDDSASQEAGAVEAALGLPLADAGRLAADLLDAVHPAVAAAVGMWWRDDAVTDRLTEYARRLPAAATREPLTGQQQLDAWARDHTLGLIDRFPVQVSPELLLVLGSALATRVRWLEPFDVVPATQLAAPGERGGFAGTVSRALRSVRRHDVRLVGTEAAGLVGAHVAASGDGLAVVSVLGAPDVAREAVLAAAYEVALGLAGARIGEHVSLFDVPTGRSDLGEVVEDTVTARGAVVRVEDGVAVLPTWRASTSLDLLSGATADGFRGAARLLARLLPPGPTALDARQVAVATYTREGFEAAAVTGMGIRAAFAVVPSEVPRRTLTLRFDRPYAAIAVAVDPPARAGSGAAWLGLPVFGAWIAEPSETATTAGAEIDL